MGDEGSSPFDQAVAVLTRAAAEPNPHERQRLMDEGLRIFREAKSAYLPSAGSAGEQQAPAVSEQPARAQP